MSEGCICVFIRLEPFTVSMNVGFVPPSTVLSCLQRGRGREFSPTVKAAIHPTGSTPVLQCKVSDYKEMPLMAAGLKSSAKAFETLKHMRGEPHISGAWPLHVRSCGGRRKNRR